MFGWLKQNRTKADLQGLKEVRLQGFTFIIKKINPMQDFSERDMPMIFASYLKPKGAAEMQAGLADPKKAQEDMKRVVRAGVVEPALVDVEKGEKKGREIGVTVDDIFCDVDLGRQLYWEIIVHSLNRFRGLKGVFFSARIKRKLSIAWRKTMASVPAV